jgi:hypothetical protein
MTPQIRLQRQHFDDLQCIREIGEAGLRQVVSAVMKLSVAPIQPSELEAVIRQALGNSEANADVVLRQLLALHGMLRQLDLKPEEVFAGLNSGLHESDWSEADFNKWASVQGVFRELFELPVVGLSAKALDLSYQHSHLMRRAQIITDIRPLFNGDATEIQGTIISHKFLVRYDDVEGEHELSLAMDERDIELLVKQCDRALKKSQTAKVQLNDKAGLTTLIPGKD